MQKTIIPLDALIGRVGGGASTGTPTRTGVTKRDMYRVETSHLRENVNAINKMNMVDASPRQRRRAKTRSRILGAARGVVARGGIDALTLSAVADTLDLTGPALYRYFPNKGALLAAVNAEVLREQREVVTRIELLSQYGDRPDPVVRLWGLVEATVSLARRQPDDFALLVATLADPRQLVDDPVHAVHMPELLGLLATVSGWIRDASDQGIVRPVDHPEDRAIGLVFAVLGALQTTKLARFHSALDPSRIALASARDLILGWGADPSQLDDRIAAGRSAARLATLETPR